MPAVKHTQTRLVTGPEMKNQILAAAILLSSLIACNGMARGAGTTDENSPASIRVENQGFADMTVYAVRTTLRVRLGLAPGHANTVFTVPTSLMSGLTQLRFIADPVGGTRPSVSQEITVAPGDSVVLTIPPL
jgi:hypothetical protein